MHFHLAYSACCWAAACTRQPLCWKPGGGSIPPQRHTKRAPVLRVGTAGWVIPSPHAHHAPKPGTHLERYARLLSCVEINSTFYRPHQQKTFERWAASTPEHFRFSVKAPRTVTHEAKLCRCGPQLAAFFENIRPLGEKLGPVLVQLPPSLAFDAGVAHEFFTTLRELHSGGVVLEPRHASWFTAEADRLLRDFAVARAMADPPAGSPQAAHPGGWDGFRYFRLHGAPRKYWSPYERPFLLDLAARLAAASTPAWVIFDNTAQNHAFANALMLNEIVGTLSGENSVDTGRRPA